MKAHRACCPNGCRLAQLLEFNAGAGAITKAAHDAGLVAWGIDKTYDKSHDCMRPRGLRTWLMLLTLTREGTLVWLAPECKSWLWLTRYCSGRSHQRIMGYEDRDWVRRANNLTYRTALVILLTKMAEVYVVLEQPVSSLMAHVPHIRAALRWVSGQRHCAWLGSYGAPSPKPVHLVGNCPWLWELHRRKRKHSFLLCVTKNGKVNGNHAALSRSQVYPDAFGKAVAIKHFDHFLSLAPLEL